MNKSEEFWVRLCSIDEIPKRGAIRVELDQKQVAIFKTADDSIYVLDDACPHKGGPLSDGIVHDNCVTCPLHNWVISLEDGCATGADEGRTTRYKVRLDDGYVHVQPQKTVWLSQA